MCEEYSRPRAVEENTHSLRDEAHFYDKFHLPFLFILHAGSAIEAKVGIGEFGIQDTLSAIPFLFIIGGGLDILLGVLLGLSFFYARYPA